MSKFRITILSKQKTGSPVGYPKKLALFAHVPQNGSLADIYLPLPDWCTLLAWPLLARWAVRHQLDIYPAATRKREWSIVHWMTHIGCHDLGATHVVGELTILMQRTLFEDWKL